MKWNWNWNWVELLSLPPRQVSFTRKLFTLVIKTESLLWKNKIHYMLKMALWKILSFSYLNGVGIILISIFALQYTTDNEGSVMGVTIPRRSMVYHCRTLTVACNYGEGETMVNVLDFKRDVGLWHSVQAVSTSRLSFKYYSQSCIMTSYMLGPHILF